MDFMDMGKQLLPLSVSFSATSAVESVFQGDRIGAGAVEYFFGNRSHLALEAQKK